MKRIGYAFIIVLCSLLFVACGGRRSIQKDRKEEIKSLVDTIIITKKERVVDSVYVQVPYLETGQRQCDSLCNEKLEGYLKGIHNVSRNARQSKGIYYDKYKRQLILYTELEEELNTYKSKKETEVRVEEKEVIKEVVKYKIPMVFKLLSAIGFLGLLYLLYMISKKIVI